MWFHILFFTSLVFAAPTIDTPIGYSVGDCLENAAINAPVDCNGANTYMGLKSYTVDTLDIERCAAACTAQSAYNLRHPPATGKPQTCQFFNTYMLYKNGVNYEQHCVLYSQSWDKSYATNTGYHSGTDKYTIVSSYSFGNATNKGLPNCAVVSVTKTIYTTTCVQTSSLISVSSPLYSNPASTPLYSSTLATSLSSLVDTLSPSVSSETGSSPSTTSSDESSSVATPSSDIPTSESTTAPSTTTDSRSSSSIESTVSSEMSPSTSLIDSTSSSSESSSFLTSTVTEPSISVPEMTSTSSPLDSSSTLVSSTELESSSPSVSPTAISTTSSFVGSSPTSVSSTESESSSSFSSLSNSFSSTESESSSSFSSSSTSVSSTESESSSSSASPPTITITSSSVDFLSTSASSTESESSSSSVSPTAISTTSSSVDSSTTSASSTESEASSSSSSSSTSSSTASESSPSSVVVVITTSATSSATPTPTWIVNGGFESTDNDGAPWVVPSDSPTGCTWEIVESADAVNGTHFAIVTCYNAGEGIWITQPFQSIDVGATYVVSVWFRKLAGTTGSAGFGCTLSIEGGPGLISSGNLTPYAPWSKQTNTFKATAAETGFALYCIRAVNGGAPDGVATYTYIDSIDVYRIPDRGPIVINGDLEDSATSAAPWYLDTNTTRTTSTYGTIAVAQTDATDAAYNGTNYLAISMPAGPVTTTLYLDVPIAVTAPIRYQITFWIRSPTSLVSSNCRQYVANDDFSKSTYLTITSPSPTATWVQKTLRFQAQGWETRLVWVCTRGTQTPDVVSKYFIDDLVISEYGP